MIARKVVLLEELIKFTEERQKLINYDRYLTTLRMGCNSSKNLTVEPFNGHVSESHSQIRRAATGLSNIPPLEAEDLPEELLENATVNNVQQSTNGMAFEIAFQEEDDSVIKKHPPKHIQERLESERSSSTVTLEKLQEKLEEAEIRRNQVRFISLPELHHKT
ncbi:unnamed protein product [Acanthoscelides obtectus]|uniref:Uncharacterized protein n=1 Tax=Acanthoscelides obtectus TaxID=200917 RepID=A0A9P0KZV1_ACAOB|nr:unnamed protein product [Acanthoscelides obtectus]CAH1999475.1 unnamed protein product [Acanthoscelides obtectus]CAK1681636.1 hypothetical protein AOBTE_LOCUS33180 [Acanthoscelides obtectus]CAK1681714.1 hypothetical protein AOBTE_LOCUS33240 [Acanthoscelides obtectus]